MYTSYTLDNTNRIIDVGGDWDDFAHQNDRAGAVSANVIGKSIWDFISGFDVQNFLSAVIAFVRVREEEFDTLYRCDSAETPRLCRMEVTPLDDNTVEVKNVLLQHPEIAPASNVLELDHNRCFNRCSKCCRFKIGEDWIEAFAYPHANLFPDSHVLCPDCKVEIRADMGEVVDISTARRNPSLHFDAAESA